MMCYNILFIFYISNHFLGGEFPRYKIAEPNSKAFFFNGSGNLMKKEKLLRMVVPICALLK